MRLKLLLAGMVAATPLAAQPLVGPVSQSQLPDLAGPGLAFSGGKFVVLPGPQAGQPAGAPVSSQIIRLTPIDPSALPVCGPTTEGSVAYVAGSIRSFCVCRTVNGEANAADGYLWSCPPP